MRFNSRGEYHGGRDGIGDWLNDNEWLTQDDMQSSWLACGGDKWVDSTQTCRSNFDYAYPAGLVAKVWDIALDGTVCEVPNYHMPYSCGVYPDRESYATFDEPVNYARAISGGDFVALVGYRKVYSSHHGWIELPDAVQAFQVVLLGDVLLFTTHTHLALLNLQTGLGRRVTSSQWYPDLYPAGSGVIIGYDTDSAGGGTSIIEIKFDELNEDISDLSDSDTTVPPPIEPIDPEEPDQPDPEPGEPMIPNRLNEIQYINSQYPHLLQQNSTATCGEFTERCVWELSRGDSRWGHVKKEPGQNQFNGHAVDAMMYRTEPDHAIDIIQGAGDQVPTNPTWGETESGGQEWMAPIPVSGGGEMPPPTTDNSVKDAEQDQRIATLESTVSTMAQELTKLQDTLTAGLRAHGPIDVPIVVESLSRMRAKGDIDVQVKTGQATPPTPSDSEVTLIDIVALKRILNRPAK